jgi:L-fuconolactonase
MNSAAKAVTASGHLAVNQAWLDQHVEAPLDPQLPIIDPHHHLWDAPKPRYLLDEVLADFQTGHNVVGSVFVECRAMYRAEGEKDLKSLGETQFAGGIAAMSGSGAYGATRVCEAIVGYVDLRLGDRVKGILEKHLAVSDGRLRGIRNIIAWHENPKVRSTSVPYPKDMLDDPGFRAGFAGLGRLGLAYDCWLYQNQLADLARFAKAFSETIVVIDHLGGPLGVGPYAGRRQEAFAEWRKGFRLLAELPNTVVKSAVLVCGSTASVSTSAPRRHPRKISPMHGAITSMKPSPCSARAAACSRAIFRSTRDPTATGCFGMRSSA